MLPTDPGTVCLRGLHPAWFLPLYDSRRIFAWMPVSFSLCPWNSGTSLEYHDLSWWSWIHFVSPHSDLYCRNVFPHYVWIFFIFLPFYFFRNTVQVLYLSGLFFMSFSLSYNYLLWVELCLPKKICWRPYPWCLRMWSYWKIGSLQVWLVKMRPYWTRVSPSSNMVSF